MSEEDRYAKTHSGTWNLFGQACVQSGRFDSSLLEQARDVLPVRLEADYEARDVSRAEAEAVLGLADRFLAAVDELYPA